MSLPLSLAEISADESHSLADKKLKSHWAQAHYEPVNLTGYV